MPDVMWTLYEEPVMIPVKDSSKGSQSSGPLGAAVINDLLCLIQTAAVPGSSFCFHQGPSPSLSDRLTQFNANGSTQERRLHINY